MSLIIALAGLDELSIYINTDRGDEETDTYFIFSRNKSSIKVISKYGEEHRFNPVGTSLDPLNI